MEEKRSGVESLRLKINFLVGYLEALECVISKLDSIKEDYEESLLLLEKLIDDYTKVVDKVNR